MRRALLNFRAEIHVTVADCNVDYAVPGRRGGAFSAFWFSSLSFIPRLPLLLFFPSDFFFFVCRARNENG